MRAFRAQAALTLSLAVPMIVGAFCIGTDSWTLYSCSSQLRRATYAAVMSGVRYLPTNPALAERTTLKVAELNGIRTDEILFSQPGADGQSITMVVARRVPYRFARMFGLSQNVTVKAVARVSAVRPGAAVPIRTIQADRFYKKLSAQFRLYERIEGDADHPKFNRRMQLSDGISINLEMI